MREGRKKMAIAPNTGDVVKISVDSVAFGGAGVGRAWGMVVFTPYTVAGEEVEVEIGQVRKRFALGKVKRILSPSPHRVSPLCRYFGRCGGCQLQHIAYEHQLEIKEKQVREIFERLGKFPSPPVSRIIPSPRSFNYRGKAEYHIRIKESGVPDVGFMHAAENVIVDIERCEIVEESINIAYSAFREAVLSGLMTSHGERQTIWSASEREEPLIDWDNVDAPPFVMRTVKDRRLLVPYGGFSQVNNALVDVLVDKVIELCALRGLETILDGYCGVGLFSLFLSPDARNIVGMEIDGEAVRCARENLKKGGFPQAAFYKGDIAFLLQERFVKKKAPLDVIVLDPPRGGCSRAVLDAVRKTGVRRLVYVSCNPATQVRDIRCLTDCGFKLRSLQPVDMFPQTAHIEVIALLEREKFLS